MQGSRVDWHLAELVASEEGDPFQGVAPVEQIGLPLDLRDPPEVLEARLRDLFESEDALERRGVTCALKDMPNSTCHACPVSKHDAPIDPLSKLCNVGREEERVLMEMNVAQQQADERVAA